MTDEVDAKLVEFAVSRRRELRNEIVTERIGLAVWFAKQYAHRGVPFDDLRQVACLGLVKAVERFDPGRGVRFSTFAGRTIEGELKRYFRDSTWDASVPRRAKELHVRVRRAREELTRVLGRPPTIEEVREECGTDIEEVVEALLVEQAHSARSLDRPSSTDDDESSAPVHALADENEIDVEDVVHADVLLDSLPSRQRRILWLRYYVGLSQAEIGERVGISQVHVSRTIRRSLETLREQSAADDPSAA